MRVVVTGASGNVGTAVVERLVADPRVEQVVGLCRRRHEWRPAKTTWGFVDVSVGDLLGFMADADVVIHLAWQFHPTRDPETTWHANVHGTSRVLQAAARANVGAVVVASSVGAYAPRRDLRPVDEHWPTTGCQTAAYSREKAAVERLLDAHEQHHPAQRVVRLRPAFIFQPRAAVEQRRIFLGPFVPDVLLRRGVLPMVPIPRGLHLQALHAADVAEAYAAAALGQATGAFNLAADPVLDETALAEVLGTRAVLVPPGMVRAALSTAFGARAAPAHPGLFDLAMAIPMMDTTRARTELGWVPRYDATAALRAFLDGLADHQDWVTPPLARATSGPLRTRELLDGVGARG
jgi:nucleoside-diphosphate-sugar epimerase